MKECMWSFYYIGTLGIDSFKSSVHLAQIKKPVFFFYTIQFIFATILGRIAIFVTIHESHCIISVTF